MSLDLLDPPTTGEASDDSLYEIIDGVRVEKSMSTLSQFFGGYLAFLLTSYCQPRRLGRVYCEALFDLPGSARSRRPDVAYVSRERWSARIPGRQPFEVVPELMVEVVSPSDTADEVADKIDEYFRGGVSEVWVVHPVHERVFRYASPTGVTAFGRTDILTSAVAILGFRLPLEELFSEADAMGPADS